MTLLWVWLKALSPLRPIWADHNAADVARQPRSTGPRPGVLHLTRGGAIARIAEAIGSREHARRGHRLDRRLARRAAAARADRPTARMRVRPRDADGGPDRRRLRG